MLISGGNLLLEGTVKLAKKFKISTMIISMTIISIGTSMPELAIGCISSFKGSQIALSNNIGSVIATIALSFGVTSIFYNIRIKKDISKEIERMLLMQLVLLILLLISNKLDMIDGIILLLIFIGYMIHIIKEAKNIVSESNEKDIIKNEEKFIEDADGLIKNSVITLSLFIIVGLVLLTVGSNFVVDSAVLIAEYFSFSEAFIAVTIVAFGTTLPEISTAILAAKKKQYDVLIGNVIGSGIANVMLITGVASIINPIIYTNTLLFQMGFMFLFGLLFYKLSTQKTVIKKDGFIILGIYIIFIILSTII